MKINKEGKGFAVVQDQKNLHPKAPPGDCILSKPSEFFTCRPADAELKKQGKEEDEGAASASDDEYELEWPRKLQISYANKALLCEVG